MAALMRKGARQKAQKGGQDDVQLFSFLRSAGKESFFRSLAEKPNFSIKALSSRARPHRGKKKSRNRESSAVLKARKTRKKSFFTFSSSPLLLMQILLIPPAFTYSFLSFLCFGFLFAHRSSLPTCFVLVRCSRTQ